MLILIIAPTVVEPSNLSCIKSRGRGEARVRFSASSIFSTERQLSECDSLIVRVLACHAADPGSNPVGGDDFFNY